MNDICQELLLTSLTEYYEDNTENKKVLKEVISGNHVLSLRMIDWLVTHFSKSHNISYWHDKKKGEIYDGPQCATEADIKKINLYLDYRAQLKSYAKVNFDSFRRHNRITFVIDPDTHDCIETTVGQLNFFRWAFNNSVIDYAVKNYDRIHQNMVENNSYSKEKREKLPHRNIQEITRATCTLRFD